jgi:hypothetical protein
LQTLLCNRIKIAIPHGDVDVTPFPGFSSLNPALIFILVWLRQAFHAVKVHFTRQFQSWSFHLRVGGDSAISNHCGVAADINRVHGVFKAAAGDMN